MKIKGLVTTIMVLAALTISSLCFATKWWDVQNVKHTQDGNLEYSIKFDNFMCKTTGDVFNGLAVLKYGQYTKYELNSISNKVYSSDIFGKSVIGLVGTINGKDISSVPIYRTEGIKYVTHNDKCSFARIYKGETKKLSEYDRTNVKKGQERLTCGCPVMTVNETVPFVSEENINIWKMIYDISVSHDVYIGKMTFSEARKTYWRPNMFNGNYMVNGREVSIDVYEEEAAIKRVSVAPLASVYSNSAVFEIYDSLAGSFNLYRVFKEGTVYKVQKIRGTYENNFFMKDPLGKEYYSYIQPTEELIGYAETISTMLGININK